MGGGQVSELMTGLLKPQVRELAPGGRPGLGSLPTLLIQPGQTGFQGPRGKNAREQPGRVSFGWRAGCAPVSYDGK